MAKNRLFLVLLLGVELNLLTSALNKEQCTLMAENSGTCMCSNGTKEDILCTGFSNLQDAWTHITKGGCTFTKDASNNIRNFSVDVLDNLTLTCNNFTQLVDVNFEMFPKLQTLDLSANNLSAIEGNVFHGLSSLETLNLSHNRLQRLSSCEFSSLNDSLKHLIISHNLLESIDSSCIAHMKKLQTIDLSHNSDLHSLNISAFISIISLEFLNLSGSKLIAIPAEITMSLEQMPDMKNNNESSFKHLMIKDPSDHTLYYKRWLSNNRTTFNQQRFTASKLLQHNIGIENPCDVYQSKQCECEFLKDRNVTKLNCTGRGIEELPSDLPLNTSVVDLSNNHIKTLNFSGERWKRVVQLNLSDNFISSLDGFSGPLTRDLKVINLRNNSLRYINVDVLQLIDFDNLYLSDNPIACNCDTFPLHSFVSLRRYGKIEDRDEIRCSADEGPLSNRKILSLKKFELCPMLPLKSFQDYLVEGLIYVVAILIILTVSKTVYDYRGMKKTGRLPKFFQLHIW